MYKKIIRPILFSFDPEKIHHFTFKMIKALHFIPGVPALFRSMYVVDDPRLKRNVFGIDFPNPVGLAAGFDKDAKLYNELANFGFGFIEIGTLTPVGQSGNELPRLFRLPEDGGLINRMGFNNHGVEDAVKRLKKRNTSVLIGGNIGKNKLTPNDLAVHDYEKCFHALYEYVDYFVVNVSSTNTKNLRELQDKEPLTKLLSSIKNLNDEKPKQKPILLKIAPDMDQEGLDNIIEVFNKVKFAGIIATNTTINRKGLKTSDSRLKEIDAEEEIDGELVKKGGGLSGRPVRNRSTEVIKYLHDKSNGEIPIIGVGGIFSPADALEKLKAGASLVQVYTGFIYEGPDLLKRINKAILADNL